MLVFDIINVSPINVSISISWIYFDGLAVIGDCLTISIFGFIGSPPIKVGFSIPWVYFQSLIKI